MNVYLIHCSVVQTAVVLVGGGSTRTKIGTKQRRLACSPGAGWGIIFSVFGGRTDEKKRKGDNKAKQFIF